MLCDGKGGREGHVYDRKGRGEIEGWRVVTGEREGGYI